MACHIRFVKHDTLFISHFENEYYKMIVDDEITDVISISTFPWGVQMSILRHYVKLHSFHSTYVVYVLKISTTVCCYYVFIFQRVREFASLARLLHKSNAISIWVSRKYKSVSST